MNYKKTNDNINTQFQIGNNPVLLRKRNFLEEANYKTNLTEKEKILFENMELKTTQGAMLLTNLTNLWKQKFIKFVNNSNEKLITDKNKNKKKTIFKPDYKKQY